MNTFKRNIPATAYCQAKAELSKEDIETLHVTLTHSTPPWEV